jgi:hypothetical protein
MFSLSKSLVLGAAAILSSTVAIAQESTDTTFRFDQQKSAEQNYEAFQITAKRACDDMSSLNGYRAEMDCRRSLIDQAVRATRKEGFIAYHDARSNEARKLASLERR